jgi:subtilisin family serine protease
VSGALVAGAWLLAWAGVVRADERAERRLRDALTPRVLDGALLRSWPARPLLDEARAAVGAELVWEGADGTRGAGATVCVVDTGLDLAHEDFRDGEGRTRVRWLYDLDAPSRGIHGALEGGVGAVWSRDEIDEALAHRGALPEDREGHGTAVASIAAGDGAGRGATLPGTYAGLAPEAELVIVSAFSEDARGFHRDAVVRGARFCADRRVSDPARTVILLALGGHDGAHDGTSAYERALEAVAAQGVVIVAAAGNDGDRSVHARGRAVRDQQVLFALRSPGTERGDAVLAVVVRGAREVRASLPSQAPSAWVGPGIQHDDGTLLVDATDPDATYVIARGPMASGDLRIEARGASAGSGVVDAWLVEDALGEVLFSPRFVGETATTGHEVTIPATAERVVSVGASVSREFLEGEGGAPGLTASADESGRASYSARGPRVDGAPLPTVIAPGGWMVAALSRALDPDAPDAPISRARFDQLRRGEDRMAFAGTSMAAAVVAGVLALGRADGSRRNDRALLSASAVSPTGSVTAAFDARVGAGRIDAAGYVSLRARDEPTAAYEVGCTRTRTAPAADDVQVVVRARRTAEARVRTRVTGAAFSGTRTMRDGFVAVPVSLPPAPLGALLAIEAEIDGELVPACTVEISEPVGPPVGVGAHCAASARSPGDPRSPAWITGLCALGLGLRRRSRSPRARPR